MKIEIETDGTHPRQLVEAARFLCSLANQGSAHRWHVVEDLSKDHTKTPGNPLLTAEEANRLVMRDFERDSPAGTPTEPAGGNRPFPSPRLPTSYR